MKNLRKLLVAGLTLALVAPVTQSCKKGEDDPFLSLRSRTGRLAGEWKLVALSGNYSDDYTYQDPSSASGDLIKSTDETEITLESGSVSMKQTSLLTYDDNSTETETLDGKNGSVTYTYSARDANGNSFSDTETADFNMDISIDLTIE